MRKPLAVQVSRMTIVDGRQCFVSTTILLYNLLHSSSYSYVDSQQRSLQVCPLHTASNSARSLMIRLQLLRLPPFPPLPTLINNPLPLHIPPIPLPLSLLSPLRRSSRRLLLRTRLSGMCTSSALSGYGGGGLVSWLGGGACVGCVAF